MPNNDAELQMIDDIIDSGALQTVIDLAVDRYFAKLDERTKPKYEPGALFEVDEAGDLQRAQMPAILEVLQSSEEGAVFQIVNGGLKPAISTPFSFSSVTGEDGRIYHFHRELTFRCWGLKAFTIWFPDTGDHLIDTDTRLYMIGLSCNSDSEMTYKEAVAKAAAWDWKNLHGASPLVREAESHGTG